MQRDGIETVTYSSWEVGLEEVSAHLMKDNDYKYKVVNIIHLKNHAPIFELENGFSVTFNRDTLVYYSEFRTLKFYRK